MLRLILALFTAAGAVTAITAEAATTPAPFSATYAVSYRGLNAGELRSTLSSEANGEFVYETRVEPSPLARLVVSSKAVERSVMQIDANGVRPLSWYSEDGKAGGDKDGALEFAWDEQRVSGVVEGQWIELPTEPMLQDRLSIQIAVMTALLRADELDTLPLLNDEKIKRYSYTRAGTERIKTKVGIFDTVIYESTRPGSSRLSRVWHARELGYVAVRAEQLRNGKIETVMELVKVKQSAG